jgi:hypothetical protein
VQPAGHMLDELIAKRHAAQRGLTDGARPRDNRTRTAREDAGASAN